MKSNPDKLPEIQFFEDWFYDQNYSEFASRSEYFHDDVVKHASLPTMIAWVKEAFTSGYNKAKLEYLLESYNKDSVVGKQHSS